MGLFIQFSSARSLSWVQLFATPWTETRQASLSITNSQSLLKLMSVESMIPSNHLIRFSSCLQSFPAAGSFPMNQLFAAGGQSIGASASVLPMNIQGLFPLGWTGLISLLSKGLSRVFSSTTIRKHQFFGAQPSLWPNSHICTQPYILSWGKQYYGPRPWASQVVLATGNTEFLWSSTIRIFTVTDRPTIVEAVCTHLKKF